MDYHIIVNSKIYQTYKQDILKMNVRMFTDANFYNIRNYQDPIDLLGIKEYLSFCERIYIDTCSSFLDFINILLILNFLNNNNYQGPVFVCYYSCANPNYEKALLMKTILFANDYNQVSKMIENIKNNQRTEDLVNKLPGSINFINFYNSLTNKDLFMSLIEDEVEEFEGDNEEIAAYLVTKYNQFGLDYDFFYKYLNE